MPAQSRSLKKALDSFWSEILQFPISDLDAGEVRIVGVDQCITIPPRWTLMAILVHGSCMVPVEHKMIEDAKEYLRDLSAEEVFTDEGIDRIRELFGASKENVAHWLHLFSDEENFKPYKKYRARRLTESDRGACEEWTSKYPRAIGPYSYQYANPLAYGIIIGGKLVSVSLVLRYNLPFWEIAVETSSDHRGRGYGKSVVSLATEEVLAAGRTPWYYTDVNPTNIASLKVAKALGYIEHSETLSLRR